MTCSPRHREPLSEYYTCLVFLRYKIIKLLTENLLVLCLNHKTVQTFQQLCQKIRLHGFYARFVCCLENLTAVIKLKGNDTKYVLNLSAQSVDGDSFTHHDEQLSKQSLYGRIDGQKDTLEDYTRKTIKTSLFIYLC